MTRKTVREKPSGQRLDSTEHELLLAAIKLSRKPGIGAKKFKELVDFHGDPLSALEYVTSQLSLFGGDPEKTQLEASMLETISELLDPIGATYYGAADYPRLLGQTKEPPSYLFFRGSLWPMPSAAVAIVGPRHCSPDGAAFAYKLAGDLAAKNVTIVSGGAQGIDTAAHRGALDVGGNTVLVTATGIDRLYPAENADLYLDVQEKGNIVTELLPGTPPRRDFFPTRNRIIVGLSAATVIVEGTIRSGTYSSACHALKLDRPIFSWYSGTDPDSMELLGYLLGKGAKTLDNPESSLILRQLIPTQDRLRSSSNR